LENSILKLNGDEIVHHGGEIEILGKVK